MEKIKEGPFLDILNKDYDKAVLRELTTYYYVGATLYKETVSRKYKKNGDYHDSVHSTPFTV